MGRDVFTKITFYNVKTAMNPKQVNNSYGSYVRLIVVNISVKFVKITQTVFKFKSGNHFMTN